MNIIQAIILGIIQGAAEFLPISSSGHLVLMQRLFKITEPTFTFDIVLHIGTLVPVVIVFWKDIVKLIKNPFQKMTFLLIIATLPAVFAALFFGDFIDDLFKSGQFLAMGFFVTGVFLMYADFISDGDKREKDISYVDAFFIGCIQAIAITPAVSRSGSTISAALSRQINRETAAKFSFLMSIPAIVGAFAFQLLKIATGKEVLHNERLLPIFLGFLAAMASGYLAIKLMLALIKRCKLKYFALYVFLLSGIILVDQFVTNIYF